MLQRPRLMYRSNLLTQQLYRWSLVSQICSFSLSSSQAFLWTSQPVSSLHQKRSLRKHSSSGSTQTPSFRSLTKRKLSRRTWALLAWPIRSCRWLSSRSTSTRSGLWSWSCNSSRILRFGRSESLQKQVSPYPSWGESCLATFSRTFQSAIISQKHSV